MFEHVYQLVTRKVYPVTRQSGVDSTHTDLGVWQSRNMATVEMSTSDMFRSRVCCRIRRGLEEPVADMVMVTFSLVTNMFTYMLVRDSLVTELSF